MSFLAKTGLVLANVKDYGARGDGVTDDTTAIQAAINDAIASSAGGVFLPPGQYQVSQITGLTVNAASDFRFLGASAGTTRIQVIGEDHAGTPLILLQFTGCSFVTIDGFELDGNKAAVTNPNSNSALLYTADSSDVDMRNLILRNSTGFDVGIGDGVTLAERITLRDSRTFNGSNVSVLLTLVSDVDVRGNRIHQFESMTTSFVRIEDANGNEDVYIRDNHFDNSANNWNGIYIGAGDRIEISRNTFRGGADGANTGIFAEAGVSGIFNLSIRENFIDAALSNSIVVTPQSGNVGRFSIQQNHLSDDVRFLAGSGVFTQIPVVVGNWGSAFAILTADYANLPEPAIIISGKYNSGDGTPGSGTRFMGDASPQGSVSGYPGDLFIDQNGGEGTTLYVKESGNGTNTGWVAYGQSSVKHLFIIAPTQSPSTIGDHVGSTISVNGNGNLEFRIPDDFNSTVGIDAVVIAGGTDAAADIDLNSDYGTMGELFNQHSESNTTITYNLTVNQIAELDVTSVFSAITANDMCGINLKANNVTGGFLLLGLRLRYM